MLYVQLNAFQGRPQGWPPAPQALRVAAHNANANSLAPSPNHQPRPPGVMRPLACMQSSQQACCTPRSVRAKHVQQESCSRCTRPVRRSRLPALGAPAAPGPCASLPAGWGAYPHAQVKRIVKPAAARSPRSTQFCLRQLASLACAGARRNAGLGAGQIHGTTHCKQSYLHRGRRVTTAGPCAGLGAQPHCVAVQAMRMPNEGQRRQSDTKIGCGICAAMHAGATPC